MSLDAMKQALAALEEINQLSIGENAICLPAEIDGAMDALRERLAQPEQEPVAWMYHGIRHDDTPHERPSLIWKPEYMDVMSAEKGAKATPLYTAPRQWQGLTDEEREQVISANFATGMWQMAKDIEAKLKEKNT